MEMLDKITLTSINEVITVPVARGYKADMVNRRQYGLSFCEGEGRILYHHNGKEYLSDHAHAVWLPMGATYLLDCRESGYFPLINFDCAAPAIHHFLSIPLRKAEGLLRSYETLKEIFLYRHQRARAMSVLYDMLASLSAEAQREEGETLLAPAMRYLEEHIADPDLQNGVLSDQAHISEVYFRRLFKEAYHTTPRQYILDLRMKRAKELLAGGVTSVSRVAELCGFSGVYHFCRVFRAATGQTPTEYRRRVGGVRI
ncbi:MAG: helix-turn-helix transcriptional regulator [Clostridia bacterium]|nr:helix-turn-helix transcriptional regulator [Clostridia bacterium]